MTVTDPEWDAEQRNWALALAEYKAGLCPQCRVPLDESTKREHDGEYVTDVIKCHACAGVAQSHRRKEREPDPEAWFHIPKLRTRTGG